MEGLSPVNPRSDSKVTREKRSGEELGERSEIDRKRVKMRDLDSVLRSEGIDTNYLKSSKTKEANVQEISQETEVPVTIASDVALEATNVGDLLRPHGQLDLNAKIPFSRKLVSDFTLACLEDNNRFPPLMKLDVRHDPNFVTSRGIGLDLNSEDVCSSVNHDPSYSKKKRDRVKSPDGISECASSSSPFEEKDPMKVWKEMKQNGFLSSAHGGIPVPKQRARKNKQDVIKKKIELAKREQVDRFTKIAAPSGLLNELNPGIINHVRNSKQVHSIIEALVKSERLENAHAGSKHASHSKSGTKEICGEKKDLENVNVSGKPLLYPSHENGPTKILPVNPSNRTSSNLQIGGNPMLVNKSISLIPEDKGGDGDSGMGEGRLVRMSCASSSTTANEDALKLSSSQAKASENVSSLSNEEPMNLNSVTSLSVKAATVASQWLDLLHQDIKGRLTALRRSKKRVRSVIHTELPFLIAKEFPVNQENDSSVTKDPAVRCSSIEIVDLHQARWSALFDQMDKSLFEEEKQLESWLHHVKEMQMHCEKGLQLFQYNQLHWQGNEPRTQTTDDSESELAIRAAAASIYSTCNFLLSMENVSCF